MSIDPYLFIAGLGPAFAGTAIGAHMGNRQIKAQKEINNQNIEEARRVMAMQREWALSDWDRVNAYNHPTQQMQRYLDAGLNPHLIYGNVSNSPAGMVKSPTQGAGRADASGIIAGLDAQKESFGSMFGMAQQAMNMYFANQRVENETNLTNAQILNLRAQTDKNVLSNKLTQTTFDDLVEKIKLNNSLMWKQGDKLTAETSNLPTDTMAHKRYKAETDRILELLEMARKENKLKQSDIDTMERLSGTRGGDKMLFELLKIILQGGINRVGR